MTDAIGRHLPDIFVQTTSFGDRDLQTNVESIM